MKKIIGYMLVILILTSAYVRAEEQQPSSNPLSVKAKEALIAQDDTDLKRQIDDLQRDLSALSRRIDRMDDKVDRIDRDVKTLKLR